MATNSATLFDGPMDPTDFVDYVHGFELVLEAGETISPSFTVTPSVEAAALGVEVSTTFVPSLVDSNRGVLAWYTVRPENRGDMVFSDDGVLVAIEVTISTTSSRTYQRTWLIRVKQL